MTFLGNWRIAIGQSILLRKLQKRSDNRKTLNFDTIKCIGLAASGTDAEYEQWTKMTKKVFGDQTKIKWLWQSTEKETSLEAGPNLVLLDKKSYNVKFPVYLKL